MNKMLLSKLEVVDICLTVLKNGTVRKSYNNAVVDVSINSERSEMYITIEDNTGCVKFSKTTKLKLPLTNDYLNDLLSDYLISILDPNSDLPM